MRLLVVGAGSTGGYLGARLTHAGRDVTFLVRPMRAAQLRTGGLTVLSPHGGFSVMPRLLTAEEVSQPFDAVLLSVKAMALEQAMQDMAPAIGPNTMILPVLNGMRHMDRLRDRFGSGPLAGCALKIATILDPEGRIVQLSPLHDLVYGELDGSITPRMTALDQAMQNAGFDARLSPDIQREMWRKWVLLAAMGAITCTMRGPIGQIAAAPGGPDYAHALIDEIVAAVTAEGHPPGSDFITATKAQLTAEGSALTSSMFRDMQERRPLEADAIVGDLLHRGQRAGLALPLLAAAYTHLSVYAGQITAA